MAKKPPDKLTERDVQKARTTRRQKDRRDGGCRGLVLRVFVSGAKTWFCDYRTDDGGRRLFKLGSYPDLGLAQARRAAERVRGRAAGGEDPQKARRAARHRPDDETVEALAERWLKTPHNQKRRRERPRSYKLDRWYLDRYLLPAIGGMAISEVARRDIKRLLNDVASGEGTVRGRAATSAPRALRGLCTRLFGWAAEAEDLANPAAGVPLPVKAASRDRVLSEAELRTLWAELVHLQRESPLSAAVFRLILLTAQRPGEVLRLRWRDLERGWWEIPAAVTKNGRAHRVPVLPMVQAELDALHSLTGGRVHVFDSPRRPGAPMLSVKTAGAWLRVRMARRAIEESGLSLADLAARAEVPAGDAAAAIARAGLVKGQRRLPGEHFKGHRPVLLAMLEQLAGTSRWTPHDLRRSASTHMGAAGVSRFVRDRLLNHTDSDVGAVYDRHEYAEEKRQALAVWERRLAAIVAGAEPGAVVSIGRPWHA